MKINTTARWLILVGVVMITSVLLSGLVASANAPPTSRSAPDSLTVERLTKADFDIMPNGINAPTASSDAAWLAAGLLLGGYDFKVDVPIVQK